MKRILVCLDGSPLAESILPIVHHLGRRSGAEIVLAQVIELPPGIPTDGQMGIDQIVAHQESEASAYLRRVAFELVGDGVWVRTRRLIGCPAAEIVALAESEDVDVVALATHGRSGLEHWLYGSVADAVLHATKRPVLLIRPRPEGRSAQLRRVVVALDGSSLAEEALPVARDLASGVGASLSLLRVVDPFPPAFGTCAAHGAALTVLEADADRYLAAVAAREQAHGVTVEVTRATGAPAEIIARHGALPHADDLVVLATHGRTGWRAALLGSVARRVVLLSGGPVLVVPTRGEPSAALAL